MDILNDLSLPQDERMQAFHTMRLESENGYLTAFDALQSLTGKYTFCGVKSLRRFLQAVVEAENVPATLRYTALTCLLNYQVNVEEIMRGDDCEEVERKTEFNAECAEKNRELREEAAEYLSKFCQSVCKADNDLATPRKLDAIIQLMAEHSYVAVGLGCYLSFLGDTQVSPEYRFGSVSSVFKHESRNVRQNAKPALFAVLRNSEWPTMYRILSGQFILAEKSVLDLVDSEYTEPQGVLLSFAEDADLDYNLRADAADVLLGLGDEEYKVKGREIITVLGRTEVPTVFGNAQNVHTETIEESVADIIRALLTIQTAKKGNSGEEVTQEEVAAAVRELALSQFPYCNNPNCIGSIKNDDEKAESRLDSCSSKCFGLMNNRSRALSALSRIELDRARYGGTLSVTLSTVLIKLYSYIIGAKPEVRSELESRLVQELLDMSGTCSSGFVSRLANVLSGYDDLFSIRISWEEQLIANFVGRMNASAKRIVEENSPFRTNRELLLSATELFIRSRPSLTEYLKAGLGSTKATSTFKGTESADSVSIRSLAEAYLTTATADLVLEEFQANVLAEMTLSTVEWNQRTNLGLFFRSNVARIREELRTEFAEYLSESEIDLYLRKAIAVYEGIRDWI